MRLKDIVFAVFALGLVGSLTVLWLAPAGLRAAPEISVTTLQGESLSMTSLRGRPVLVNFWATSCKGCVREIPHLTELYRDYASRGLEIIGITMAYDRPDRVLAMSKARGIPYPLALDIDSRAAAAFGDVRLTPSSFLIAPDGKVVYEKTGRLDMNRVRQLLSAMLAGKDRATGS
jgi:peroxiredoxin